MELHIVHTNAKHNGDVAAATNPDLCYQNGAYCGLAVVGILFHVGSEDNIAMKVSCISHCPQFILNQEKPSK